MLLEMLAGNIQVLDKADDWKDAIRIAARPLINGGNIEARYVDAMIKMCEEHNAYIVLDDLFAMPHASPESGVIKMGTSLTILKEPADFMGKQVKVMLTLAPGDKKAHLSLLKEVSKILGDPDNVLKLAGASDAAEVEAIIEENLGGGECL